MYGMSAIQTPVARSCNIVNNIASVQRHTSESKLPVLCTELVAKENLCAPLADKPLLDKTIGLLYPLSLLR